jgi:hypothetical protein
VPVDAAIGQAGAGSTVRSASTTWNTTGCAASVRSGRRRARDHDLEPLVQCVQADVGGERALGQQPERLVVGRRGGATTTRAPSVLLPHGGLPVPL